MKKTKYVLTLMAGAALALTPMTLTAAETTPVAAESKKADGFIGKITAMDAVAKTLTVEQKKDDKVMNFTLTEETKFVDEEGKVVEMAAVPVGTKVRVTADDGATEAKKIKVVPEKDDKDEKKED